MIWIFKLWKKIFKPQREPGLETNLVGGLLKDKKDMRDYIFVGEEILPESVSLQKFCPPVKSQGFLQSCCSHAFITCYEILTKMNKPNYYMEGSELFHYYVARKENGQETQNVGMSMRDGAKALRNYGYCFEILCPYSYLKYKDEPNQIAYYFANKFKIKSYHRCEDVGSIKAALFNNSPVALGVYVTKEFKKGEYHIKFTEEDKTKLGGHGITIVAYSEMNQAFLIYNSWGNVWGKAGYAWLPYEYVEKYLIDAWFIVV